VVLTEPETPEPKPFTIELGALDLTPYVLVAMQIAPYVGEDSFFQSGDVAEQGGFRLRRARLGFVGDFDHRAAFAVTTQLSSDEDALVKVRDAWLGYTEWPWLRGFAGAINVPYSRSAIASSSTMALIERPLAIRALAPFNQIGVVADGSLWDGKLGYTAGVFNGFQRTNHFYAGYIENYAPFGNRFDGLAYAARLRSEPLGRLDPSIADEEHSELRFGVGASYFYSDGGTRDLHGAGGDALLHVAGFHLLAEGLWMLSQPETEPSQPTTQLEQVSSTAFVGEAGYMILARTLGVAARFEWIDPNANVDNEGDNWLLTAGASYQFVDRLLKVQADYTHREELHGLSLANDSFMLQLQLQLAALTGVDVEGKL